MSDQEAPTRRKKGANPLGPAPGILHSLAADMQAQDSLSPPVEQARIAERLSLAYQRQAREQRGALALQAAGLARHFGQVQRAHLGGAR